MAKSKKASGGKTAPLNELQPEESAAVLKRLLASHPKLLPEAEQTWRSTMGEVSFDLPLTKANKVLRIVTLGSEFRFGNGQWEEICHKWVCKRADCHQDRLFLTLIARSVVTAEN